MIVDLVRAASNAIPEICDLKSEMSLPAAAGNYFAFVEQGAEVYAKV